MAKVSKNKLRNLKQYKGLSDEEFEGRWEEYTLESDDIDIEDRIETMMEDFSKNYDLRDMNANDTLALKELASIFIMLEDLRKMEWSARASGEVAKLGQLSKIRKDYLDNVSRLQNDLNITRKSRQNDSGETLDTYLPSIQKKAKNFLEQRLAYIYCPECHMLCATTWFNNWELENNMLLICPREECSTHFSAYSRDLRLGKNKNVEGVLNI
jgi:hypothetical protein